MTWTALTPDNANGPNPTTLAALTWTAGAPVGTPVGNEGNSVPLTGREIVLFRNDNVAAQTVTVDSVADPFNRTGDLTAISIPAGAYRHVGPFSLGGWRQGDNALHIIPQSADIFIAVIRY